MVSNTICADIGLTFAATDDIGLIEYRSVGTFFDVLLIATALVGLALVVKSVCKE
jgi:hypothetical protein